jgi:hypothetical protein
MCCFNSPFPHMLPRKLITMMHFASSIVVSSFDWLALKLIVDRSCIGFSKRFEFHSILFLVKLGFSTIFIDPSELKYVSIDPSEFNINSNKMLETPSHFPNFQVFTSLFSMATTLAMDGRSEGSICTHNSPTCMTFNII